MSDRSRPARGWTESPVERAVLRDPPSPRTELANPHTVYRLYTEDGELIYVGLTNDPARRIGEHANMKAWWRHAAFVALDHYPTRGAAYLREKRLIQEHTPRGNTAHVRPAEADGPPCSNCGQAPIDVQVRGLCNTCNRYLLRNGEHRPEELYALRTRP